MARYRNEAESMTSKCEDELICMEHRGVSSRASTALGQPGSDVPLARHSLPGQVLIPYAFMA